MGEGGREGRGGWVVKNWFGRGSSQNDWKT